MTGTQQRLRELMETAAGEPPRSVSFTDIRRQARRRRAAHRSVAAIAAAVAVTGVALGVSALAGSGAAIPPRYGSTGFQGPVTLPPAAGVPEYYVARGSLQTPRGQYHGQLAQPGRTVVRATATGAVTATVRCPWAGSQVWDVAATQDDDFFVACAQVSGSQLDPVPVGTQIYRFQVTSTGEIAGYAAVPGGWLPHQLAVGLAAAANGSALATQVGSDGTVFAGVRYLVINTRTGATATWTPGPVQQGGRYPSDLSLSPDGKTMTFYTGNMTAFLSGAQLRQHSATWGDVAQVSPASRGGSLRSARVLLPAAALAGLPPQIRPYLRANPDGRSVFVVAIGGPGTTPYLVAEQVSVATGRVTRVVFRAEVGGYAHSASGGSGGFGGTASADPSGRHLILQFGPEPHAGNGWLRGGRLVPLTPVNDAGAGPETW
jgi:hypothetical protein